MNTSTIERYKARRLSMVDNAWLHMEMPTNLMMVGSLVFFDEAFDREQLLASLRTRLLNHPRFVQRVEASPIGPPRWVPDRTVRPERPCAQRRRCRHRAGTLSFAPSSVTS